jgi:hypothetical protein
MPVEVASRVASLSVGGVNGSRALPVREMGVVATEVIVRELCKVETWREERLVDECECECGRAARRREGRLVTEYVCEI